MSSIREIRRFQRRALEERLVARIAEAASHGTEAELEEARASYAEFMAALRREKVAAEWRRTEEARTWGRRGRGPRRREPPPAPVPAEPPEDPAARLRRLEVAHVLRHPLPGPRWPAFFAPSDPGARAFLREVLLDVGPFHRDLLRAEVIHLLARSRPRGRNALAAALGSHRAELDPVVEDLLARNALARNPRSGALTASAWVRNLIRGLEGLPPETVSPVRPPPADLGPRKIRNERMSE